jgi:hypothetical protein
MNTYSDGRGIMRPVKAGLRKTKRTPQPARLEEQLRRLKVPREMNPARASRTFK